MINVLTYNVNWATQINIKIIDIRIPKVYNSLSRNNTLFSDHKPVLAKINILN